MTRSESRTGNPRIKHGVDEGEDRRVHPNPERQRQRRHQREPLVLDEQTDRRTAGPARGPYQRIRRGEDEVNGAECNLCP